MRILPFTAEYAYFASEFEAELRTDGSDVQDNWIDSLMDDLPITGVTIGASIARVTRNVRDFEPVEGVSLEEY